MVTQYQRDVGGGVSENNVEILEGKLDKSIIIIMQSALQQTQNTYNKTQSCKGRIHIRNNRQKIKLSPQPKISKQWIHLKLKYSKVRLAQHKDYNKV